MVNYKIGFTLSSTLLGVAAGRLRNQQGLSLPPMTYKEQLSSPKWQKRRLQIFDRDNWTCCICGDTETELHVHHKRYDFGKKAWEAEDDDLQTVCKFCHITLTEIQDSKRDMDLVGGKVLNKTENELLRFEIIKVNDRGGIGDALISLSSIENGDYKHFLFLVPKDILKIQQALESCGLYKIQEDGKV